MWGEVCLSFDNFTIIIITFFAGGLLLRYALKRLKKARKVKDTPKSKIASAPQGHVEVEGFAWPMTKPAVTLIGGNAVYYTIKLQRLVYKGSGKNRRNEWETCWSMYHRDAFYLMDGTGLAIVNPEGAELEIAASRTNAWDKLDPKTQTHFRNSILDENVKNFPPKPGLWGWLTKSTFRLVEEEILVGSPIYSMGEFKTSTTAYQAEIPAAMVHFANLVFDPATREQKNLMSVLDTNGNGKVSAKEARGGYASAAARAMTQKNPAATSSPALHFKIQGEIQNSAENHFLISDRHEWHLLATLQKNVWPQLITGSALLTFSIIWALHSVILPWMSQKEEQAKASISALPQKPAKDMREAYKEKRQRELAKFDRKAFGLQAEEVPSTSFEIDMPSASTPIPLALRFGIFLIDPDSLMVMRYDDDLRGVGEKSGFLHTSAEGQVVVQDQKGRLVVLDIVNRSRTVYPFQALAATIEGGDLYWVKADATGRAGLYRTRIKDFDTHLLAGDLKVPAEHQAEFMAVSGKLHLLVRKPEGMLLSKFEILLDDKGVTDIENPELAAALKADEERIKMACPACDVKEEPVTGRFAGHGQLNTVYEIYTKRIFWIGNEHSSRLVSSAGPDNPKFLEGPDCLRQPQICLEPEVRYKLLTNYKSESAAFWAAQTKNLHYMCMSSGGLACDALLYALEGKQISPGIREQYLWAACRATNRDSCQRLIDLNVPYKGWAAFAMDASRPIENRLPASQVDKASANRDN